MQTSGWYDKPNRKQVFEASVSDLDMAALRPESILADVRHGLAKMIVDKIMEKLGPVLDEALSRITIEPMVEDQTPPSI